MSLVFGNNATATVSSGGTTAPAAGTSQSWTISGAAGFPSALVSGNTFHIADPVLPSEKILVTAISGSTWTVTRGDEGTTPVAHTSGFTIQQVVTAGEFAYFTQAFNVMSYGAKGDGSTNDTTAIQAALTAAGAVGGGTVFIPDGTFISGALTIPQNVALRGAGIMATTLKLSSGAGQFDNLLMNAQLIGTTFDANCCQVYDMTLDGNKGAMSSGWWNSGLVFSNRTPTGSFEFVDGRHMAANLMIQNFTGDGFVQAGRGVVQASRIQAWICDGFGFNLCQDSEYTLCDAGSCGLDGFIIQQGSNRLNACKAWFCGRVLTSSRTTGASALTVTAPSGNAFDGGSITGGLTFSLANCFGNGFLWRNITGTSLASNASGGSYTSMGAQDNARAGFCIFGNRQVFSGMEADSNGNCGCTTGTTPLASFAGVDIQSGFNIAVDGVSWDRAANTNHQAAALNVLSSAGTNRVSVRLQFAGTLNDGSNMPPLQASSATTQISYQFASMGTGSYQSVAFASTVTPDPFKGEVVKIGTLTTAITIANPAMSGTNTTGIFLIPGMRLTLIVTQASAAVTPGMGSAYSMNGKSFNTANSSVSAITFIWDGTSWQAV